MPPDEYSQPPARFVEWSRNVYTAFTKPLQSLFCSLIADHVNLQESLWARRLRMAEGEGFEPPHAPPGAR